MAIDNFYETIRRQRHPQPTRTKYSNLLKCLRWRRQLVPSISSNCMFDAMESCEMSSLTRMTVERWMASLAHADFDLALKPTTQRASRRKWEMNFVRYTFWQRRMRFGKLFSMWNIVFFFFRWEKERENCNHMATWWPSFCCRFAFVRTKRGKEKMRDKLSTLNQRTQTIHMIVVDMVYAYICVPSHHGKRRRERQRSKRRRFGCQQFEWSGSATVN